MDFNSSLPIRTENPGDAVIKIADATIPTRQLTVNADGSVNITDNGSSITVDAVDLDIRNLVFATDKVDVSGSNVSITGTVAVSATDLDIRNLTFAQDKVDASGSVVALDAPTLAALENITVQNGAGVAAVNIQDGGNSITVDATDLDIRNLTHATDSIKVGDGTDFLAVNADGSINVVVTDSTPGTAVNDYNLANNVAGGATSTHTYTSTGNFYLTQIQASASGRAKIEIAVNGVTKFVQFNSTANPNMEITLTQPILVTNGQTVTIARTNRDLLSMDIYSTISGYTL